MTNFNALDESDAHNAFLTAVNGRLFFKKAPAGTSLAEGAYATFFFVTDVDEDTFSENLKEITVQFSLFSGNSSDDEILDMDTNLTALFKDKIFTVTGWTVATMRRIQGNGPVDVEETTEVGAESYKQFDTDYLLIVNKA